MDDESRFLLDLNGYLHLRGALGARELAACRASVDRLVDLCAAVADGSAPPDAVPEGFGNGAQPGKPGSHGYANGYAWEKPLEQLVFHRRLWPIVREPPPCCLAVPTPLPPADRRAPLTAAAVHPGARADGGQAGAAPRHDDRQRQRPWPRRRRDLPLREHSNGLPPRLPVV